MIMCDKLWACLQQLDVLPNLQQAIEAMYTAIFAKVQIIGHTHGEEMSDIGVKQGCHVPPSYSACALMKLKHIWMISMGILHVCLPQWLTFFFNIYDN
jgi:hypothetical protein